MRRTCRTHRHTTWPPAAFLAILVVGAVITMALSPRPTAAQSALIPKFDAACQTTNPFFITTCFALGVRDTEPAIVAFHDTPDDSEHHVLATYGQVGSTFGVAYDGRRRLGYAAAFHKRASPFGPGGPGMIALGSFTVLIGKLPAGRVNDITMHPACVAIIPSPLGKVLPPGCPTVLIGG